MLQTPSSQNHPLISLIYLVLLAAVGGAVFGLLALGIGHLVYGPSLNIQDTVAGSGSQGLGFMRIFQILSSTGTFIVPSLFFSRIESRQSISFLKLNPVVPFLAAFLAILLIFSFSPLLDYFGELNKAMHLPGWMRPLEQWMQQKENDLGALTERLLTMPSRIDLSINLLMIAVLPAIGEEFFFRGCIQQTIGRWVNNDHLAVWITAIIFSAIHLQFYGFIPRALLGALLGYLFLWGKSIWLPVLAHLTNNAAGVISSYLDQQKGLPVIHFEKSVAPSYSLCWASAAITGILLYLYWRSNRDIAPPNLNEHGG